MLGKKPKPKSTFPDFEVPARFEDLVWKKEEGLSWVIYSATIGPFFLTVREEPGEVAWNVSNGESLTSVSRVDIGDLALDAQRGRLKCFIVVNYLRILKDDFAELEKP